MKVFKQQRVLIDEQGIFENHIRKILTGSEITLKINSLRWGVQENVRRQILHQEHSFGQFPFRDSFDMSLPQGMNRGTPSTLNSSHGT